MSKRMITVKEFADELIRRIEHNKTIDCCKDEMLNLAAKAKEKMGAELIEVSWRE